MNGLFDARGSVRLTYLLQYEPKKKVFAYAFELLLILLEVNVASFIAPNQVNNHTYSPFWVFNKSEWDALTQKALIQERPAFKLVCMAIHLYTTLADVTAFFFFHIFFLLFALIAKPFCSTVWISLFFNVGYQNGFWPEQLLQLSLVLNDEWHVKKHWSLTMTV